MLKEVENVLENIRRLRIEKGLSIIELANLANVSRSYIFYLESKRKIPSLETLIKISKALGVRPQELF